MARDQIGWGPFFGGPFVQGYQIVWGPFVQRDQIIGDLSPGGQEGRDWMSGDQMGSGPNVSQPNDLAYFLEDV